MNSENNLFISDTNHLPISQAIYFDPVNGSQNKPWAFDSDIGVHFFNCPGEAEVAYSAHVEAETEEDAVEEQSWV